MSTFRPYERRRKRPPIRGWLAIGHPTQKDGEAIKPTLIVGPFRSETAVSEFIEWATQEMEGQATWEIKSKKYRWNTFTVIWDSAQKEVRRWRKQILQTSVFNPITYFPNDFPEAVLDIEEESD